MEIEKLQIAKLNLRDGDTIAVKMNREVPRHVAERILDHVQQVVGPYVNVLFVDTNTSLTVIRSVSLKKVA